MRSGRPTVGMALAGWLLLLLAGLLLATPAATRAWHASAPAIAGCTGQALPAVDAASATGACAGGAAATADPAVAGDGHPQSPTPLPESPLETESPADHCRSLHGLPPYAGRDGDDVAIPANARTGHPSPEGLLPHAHAPPSAC